MQSLRTFSQSRNSLLLAVVALSLLVRAAVPAGWMPDFAGGAVRISLCSDEGRTTAWIGSDGKVRKSDPSGGEHKDIPCAFGSAAAAPDQPLLLVVASPVAGPGSPGTAAAPAMIGHGLAAPPPPATGPPALS